MKFREHLITLSDSEMLSAQAFDKYKNNYKTKYGNYVSGAVARNDLRFDATDTGNMPFAEYVTTKRNTALSNIDNYNN